MTGIVYQFFRNNQREVVRAMLQHHQGRDVADIRVWLPKADGQLVPSPRGLAIDQSLLPDLESAVRALRLAVDAQTPTAQLANAG